MIASSFKRKDPSCLALTQTPVASLGGRRARCSEVSAQREALEVEEVVVVVEKSRSQRVWLVLSVSCTVYVECRI